MMIKKLIIIVCLAGNLTTLFAETGKTGTTALNSLKIGVDARVLGLGGSGTAIYGSSMSAYWNPAAIGALTTPETAFMLNRYVLDMQHNYLSFATQFDNKMAFAFSLSYFTSGKIEKTEYFGKGDFETIGTYSMTDFIPMITGTYSLAKHWTVGATVKPIFQSIGTYSGQTIGFDFGSLYYTDKFSLGLAVRNIGASFTLIQESFPLPGILAVGGTFSPAHAIMFTTDFQIPFDNEPEFIFGLELRPVELLQLRAGYNLGPRNQELGKNTGFGAGIGLNLFGLSINYAYNPMGFLDEAHRISLHFTIKDKKKTELNLNAAPKRISPDNDGQDDACIFKVDLKYCNDPDFWELQIYNTQRQVVKRWYGSGIPPTTFIWSGDDQGKKRLPAGEYYYTFSLRGCEEEEIFHAGKLYIITEAPILQRPLQTIEQGPATQQQPQPQSRLVTAERHFTFGDILFDTDQAAIRADQYYRLEQLIEFLHQYPNANLTIAGHTDSHASDEYNMQLSIARATSIKLYLLDHTEIIPSHVDVVGYGETRSIADNSTAKGRQLNRRVEVTVYYQTAREEISAPAQEKRIRDNERVLDSIKLAAYKYDNYFRTRDPRLRTVALTEAREAEMIARWTAQENGYSLKRVIVGNQVSFSQVLRGVPELQNPSVWKRVYSVWQGELVDFTRLHEGQALFILYIR